MPKRIDTSTNDEEAGIRFHMSSGRMAIDKLSVVAFQRYLDVMERSMFLCPECGWRGWGRELIATEIDGNDSYAFSEPAETWFACPSCEGSIASDSPIMKSI